MKKITIDNRDLNQKFIDAVKADDFYLVKNYLEKGADVSCYYDLAIQLASRNGYLKIVECLVENGADIHHGGEEPLRRASVFGHFDIVKYCEWLKQKKLENI